MTHVTTWLLLDTWLYWQINHWYTYSNADTVSYNQFGRLQTLWWLETWKSGCLHKV